MTDFECRPGAVSHLRLCRKKADTIHHNHLSDANQLLRDAAQELEALFENVGARPSAIRVTVFFANGDELKVD